MHDDGGDGDVGNGSHGVKKSELTDFFANSDHFLKTFFLPKFFVDLNTPPEHGRGLIMIITRRMMIIILITTTI